MTASELTSVVIFGLFLLLLVIGAVSTLIRSLRYRQEGIKPPRLLKRDAILLTGLALPFLLIAFVRAFDLNSVVRGADDSPYVWYLLVTGIPPIVALAVYCYFELWVIERPK